MTTARYGGRLSAFTPRNIPGTHFHYGLSRPQGNGFVGRKYVTEKSSDNTGNRSRDRPQRLNRYATPGPLNYVYNIKITHIVRWLCTSLIVICPRAAHKPTGVALCLRKVRGPRHAYYCK